MEGFKDFKMLLLEDELYFINVDQLRILSKLRNNYDRIFVAHYIRLTCACAKPFCVYILIAKLQSKNIFPDDKLERVH